MVRYLVRVGPDNGSAIQANVLLFAHFLTLPSSAYGPAMSEVATGLISMAPPQSTRARLDEHPSDRPRPVNPATAEFLAPTA